MAVYLTKTWGFDIPCGPLQFSQQGWRDRARSALNDGDLVVIVGTQGDQTSENERGNLLGVMEPTKSIVSSLDYNLTVLPEHYDNQGSYKWPFGLEIRNAWRFVGTPRPLREFTTRRFGMNSASGIVLLSDDEAARILACPREQVALLQPTRLIARRDGEEAARRRGAPPPSTTARTGVMHLRNAPAFTYVMRLEGSERAAFKVGWAFDWRARERQFNSAAMPFLGGIRYQTVLKEMWPTARLAFRMEQALLGKFDAVRHPQNREILAPLTYQEIEAAWIRHMAGSRTYTSER